MQDIVKDFFGLAGQPNRFELHEIKCTLLLLILFCIANSTASA